MGVDETLEEQFNEMMKDGAAVEMGMVPGQAAVSIGIRYPEEESGTCKPE